MYANVIYNKHHVDEILKKNIVSNEIIKYNDDDIVMMNSINYKFVDCKN